MTLELQAQIGAVRRLLQNFVETVSNHSDKDQKCQLCPSHCVLVEHQLECIHMRKVASFLAHLIRDCNHLMQAEDGDKDQQTQQVKKG